MSVWPCTRPSSGIGRAEGLRRQPLRRSRESGYAMVMALIMVAAFVIGSQMAVEHFATVGRRQREERTKWCGEQYARAIMLFYRKTGRYPQSLDELKEGIPGVHFLRIEAYKYPMNPDDEWRLIYVNGAGQIIGSTRYATQQQMAFLIMNGMQPWQTGGQPGQSLQPDTAGSSFAGSSGASGPPADDGCGPPIPGTPAAGGQSSTGQSSAGTGPNGSTNPTSSSSAQGYQSSTGQPSSGQPVNPFVGLQPTGPVDGPVIGAFLTGVGGPKNEDTCSVRFYQGARKYNQWEFIWNPVLDQARALQQGMGAAAQPGASGPPTGPNGGPAPPATPSGQQSQ
jgi:hypothetical protein